jgi:phosphatidylethanolamine/phosphatidyl-N-methylethanolamine N-methyltransferase
MAKDIELSTIHRAYTLWAPFYDKVYKRMLRSSQQAASQAAVRAGSTILEVGVGTGLSLGNYPANSTVVGVDLSHPMLLRAKAKVADNRLHAIAGLAVMDACRLALADNSFDAVVGAFMITLVPDAEGALDEFARVLKPGGEIVLVNHIGADHGPMATFEKWVAPLAKRVGWRAEFPLQRIRDWGKAAGFDVMETQRLGVMGYFTLIRLRDARASAQQNAA